MENDNQNGSPEIYHNTFSSPQRPVQVHQNQNGGASPEIYLNTISSPPQQPIQAPHPQQHVQATQNTLEVVLQGLSQSFAIEPRVLKTIIRELSHPPASRWDEEKWVRAFSELQTTSVFFGGIPIGLYLFGLVGLKSNGLSEKCTPVRHMTDRYLGESWGAFGCFLITIAVLMVMKIFVNGRSQLQLAQIRKMINIGSTCAGLLIIGGLTLLGMASIDVLQIRLGYWSCSSTVQVLSILLCIGVVFADRLVLSGIYHLCTVA